MYTCGLACKSCHQSNIETASCISYVEVGWDHVNNIPYRLLLPYIGLPSKSPHLFPGLRCNV
jgi:hypothetical protein